jgi:hypothetical protein
MGEKYKDFKISIYEAYFLKEIFKTSGKNENPFKIDKNLKIINLDKTVGEQIL